MANRKRVGLPIPVKPENGLSGKELHGILFAIQGLKSSMQQLKGLFTDPDFVERFRKMYNSDDGGAGTELDIFVNDVTGQADFNQEFNDFLESAGNVEAGIVSLINGSYNGHGIVGGDYRTSGNRVTRSD